MGIGTATASNSSSRTKDVERIERSIGQLFVVATDKRRGRQAAMGRDQQEGPARDRDSVPPCVVSSEPDSCTITPVLTREQLPDGNIVALLRGECQLSDDVGANVVA